MIDKIVELVSGSVPIKIGAFVSLITGAVTILAKGYEWFQALTDFIQARHIPTGIYKGYWIDPANRVVNHEILRVSRRLNGFLVRPIYFHKEMHHYLLRIRPNTCNSDVYHGTWKRRGSTIYRGSALFKYNSSNNEFSGRWLGPRSSGESNGGEWVFKHHPNQCKYLTSSFTKSLLGIGGFLSTNPFLLKQIIRKHEEKNKTECTETVSNIKLSFRDGCFVPNLAKISTSLPEHASKLVNRSSRVLDLGTGSGFYAIYLAKYVGCDVVGVDISTELKTLAEVNSNQNGTELKTEFRVGNKDDLFSSIRENEKFDLIVANLPFTRRSFADALSFSDYNCCFTGSPRLLEQLILGASHHIKPHGHLMFCFGRSGYTGLLSDLLEVSAWVNSRSLLTKSCKDDTFYIYCLDVAPEFRTLLEKINQP